MSLMVPKCSTLVLVALSLVWACGGKAEQTLVLNDAHAAGGSANQPSPAFGGNAPSPGSQETGGASSGRQGVGGATLSIDISLGLPPPVPEDACVSATEHPDLVATPINIVPEALCDGSSNVRLAMHVDDAGPYYYDAEQGFLVVTGQCKFWAGVGSMHKIHHGDLSAATAQQMVRDLGVRYFPKWAECSSFVPCPQRIGDPVPVARIAVAGYPYEVAQCFVAQNPTASPSTQVTFGQALLAGWYWTRHLFSQGVEGPEPLLVSVSGPFPTSSHLEAEWPLPIDIHSIPSRGALISDPSQVNTLKALRTRFAAEPLNEMYRGAQIRVEPDGLYVVSISDTLPPEVQAALDQFEAIVKRK